MNEKYINNLFLNLMAKDDSLNPETRELITSVLKSNCDDNAKIALIESIIEGGN